MVYAIIVFHEQVGVADCFHDNCYTMTLINKLNSPTVPLLKHAVKCYVPAPQLPIVSGKDKRTVLACISCTRI